MVEGCEVGGGARKRGCAMTGRIEVLVLVRRPAALLYCGRVLVTVLCCRRSECFECSVCFFLIKLNGRVVVVWRLFLKFDCSMMGPDPTRLKLPARQARAVDASR